MKDFKKAILSTFLVFLIFVSASLGLLISLNDKIGNENRWLREKLAGSLDFLIIGASHAYLGFDTRIVDQILGCNCYNYGVDSLKNYEKKYVLNQDIGRNVVKTVVLEVSYTTLVTDEMLNTRSLCYALLQMNTFADRIRYFFERVNLENKLYVGAQWLWSGFDALKRQIFSQQPLISEEAANLKGSVLLPSNDYRLSPQEAVALYDSVPVSVSDFDKDAVEGFAQLIDLCHDYGVQPVVVVVPVADSAIWQYQDLDDFDRWARELCREHDAPYYDFNLLKDRYTLFSDETCFSTDIMHMSAAGAHAFTHVFANILKDAGKGVDVSQYFYSSFTDVKLDSPYRKYLPAA